MAKVTHYQQSEESCEYMLRKITHLGEDLIRRQDNTRDRRVWLWLRTGDAEFLICRAWYTTKGWTVETIHDWHSIIQHQKRLREEREWAEGKRLARLAGFV